MTLMTIGRLPLLIGNLSNTIFMDIEIITFALDEAKQIQSRRDGVHSIHGIVSVLGAYKVWVEKGIWDKNNQGNVDFEASFDFLIRSMRNIDKTGFPLKEENHYRDMAVRQKEIDDFCK